MLMGDHKRALYDFSAAILNETKHANKQVSVQGKKAEIAEFYSKLQFSSRCDISI